MNLTFLPNFVQLIDEVSSSNCKLIAVLVPNLHFVISLLNVQHIQRAQLKRSFLPIEDVHHGVGDNLMK